MTPDDIAPVASHLEKMLKRAVRSKTYPVSDLPVLQAAALEVCELEYALAVGASVWDCDSILLHWGMSA